MDLTNLATKDIALLAVAATLFAAVIGAVSALTVAIVNAVAARKQARALAHRDYLLKTLQPVLDYTEALAKGHELVYFAIRKPDEQLAQAVKEANVKFADLSGLGLVMRTPKLREKWKAVQAAEQDLHRLIGEIDYERDHRNPLGAIEDKYDEALKPLRKAVMEFRVEAERVIF